MDIEFGKLQHSTPQHGLRPDQDGQLAVVSVGNPQPHELAIYVDLDVMRDMEAHAISNTRVELGGVMLGYQRVDNDGNPFVVVNDCLRAEHYQATKGSFKFTHDTWSQITRDRAKFKPELEMVGWYHTHPGWSVFLSGMDLFICDNFFKRPLDVALVIDPCQDDRGWFFWGQSLASTALPVQADDNVNIPITTDQEDISTTEDSAPLRTAGFYLTTGRFRKEELVQYANLYNRPMNRDPRYSNPNSGQSATGHTMVHLTDQRKPMIEVALATNMFAQFLLLAVLGWKITTAPAFQSADSKTVADLKEQIAGLESKQRSQIERQAQQEVLQMLVSAKDGSPDFVERYSALATDLEQLKSNLTAQIALSEQLKKSQSAATSELEEKNTLNERLSSELQTARQQLGESRRQAEQLTNELKNSRNGVSPSAESALKKFELPWWATIAIAIAVLAAGLGLGFLFGRAKGYRDASPAIRLDGQGSSGG